MKFKSNCLNLINPFYYIGKKRTNKKEKKVWGELEIRGIDLIEKIESKREEYYRYQITRPQHLEFIRQYLNSCNIRTSDRIIDIGCGKGGMLCEFSTFEFGKISGLEFSEELCFIAKSNLKKLGITANIICEDALIYNNYDEYNFFYMYNPFGEEIMQNVVRYIKESIERTPRKIHIIYTNPSYGDLFKHGGFIIEKKFKVSLFFAEEAVVYTNVF